MAKPKLVDELAAVITAAGLGGLTIFFSGTKWQVSRRPLRQSDGWNCVINEDLATALSECLDLPREKAKPEPDDDLAVLFGKKRKSQ